MNVPFRLLLLVLCMIGGGFFAGMETGVISINRLRLRHLVQHRVPAALILERMLHRPELLLGTTLVGTNLCYVAISVMATSLATHWLSRSGPAVASVVTTLGILVCCEYLPKSWFQSVPARRTMPFARLLWLLGRLLFPFSWVITRTVQLVLPAGGDAGASDPAFLTRDELLHLTKEGEQTGILTSDESRMIHSVFELGGKRCGEIMIPRDRMICVNHDLPREALLETARERSVSRFPVRHNEQDAFVGIVNIFDVLSDDAPEGKTVQDYLRHPQFVSADTEVDHVMPRMRVTRQPMMLVTDGHFEVVGLITLEDVLNEIVGYL